MIGDILRSLLYDKPYPKEHLYLDFNLTKLREAIMKANRLEVITKNGLV